MKKIIFLIISFYFLLLATPTRAANVFTDTFTTADDTQLCSYSSNYSATTPTSCTWWKINSNQLAVNTTGWPIAVEYSGLTLPADYKVSVDFYPIDGTTNQANVIVSARGNYSGGQQNQYDFFYYWTGSTSTSRCMILKQTAGVQSILTDVACSVPVAQWHTATIKVEGSTITGYLDNVQKTSTTDTSFTAAGKPGLKTNRNIQLDNYKVDNLLPDAVQKIMVTPATSTVSVGQSFNVNVVVDGDDVAFNAAAATVSTSSNLTVLGVHTPSVSACNLQYTTAPTKTNPSFAGAIYGGSSTECAVYTMTLMPTATGSASISLTNASIKAYADNSEIGDGVTDGQFTVTATDPSPTPMVLPTFTINSLPTRTYVSSLLLGGTKNSTITQMFINGSDSGMTYPTSSTWQKTVSLSLGANTFSVYGEDNADVQTDTLTTTVYRHSLGDINGDTVVNLIDISLFATDWGKTSGLTYSLSDMNSDGVVNLTDLSIIAKLL